MPAQLVALLACVVTMTVCGQWSALVLWKMVDAVNAQLPPNEQFTHYWWHPVKYARLLREYRRLYPSGSAFTQLRALWIVMLISLFGGALALGLGPGAAVFLGIGGAAIAWVYYRASLVA